MIDLFAFERLVSAVKQIVPYFGVTLQMVVTVVIFGSMLGLAVAILRINKIPMIDQVLSLYISFMRGTPLAVQMMIVYYGLPMFLKGTFGFDINYWDKLVFVEIAFIINEGAFLGEIFQSAILAVPYQQTEAGYSVGLNRLQTFTRIVLPQAVRIVLPAYGSDIIGIFHNTSIAFMIGVVDIVGRARSIKFASGHGMEAYIFVAIIYIAVSSILKYTFNRLDVRLTFERGNKHGI